MYSHKLIIYQNLISVIGKILLSTQPSEDMVIKTNKNYKRVSQWEIMDSREAKINSSKGGVNGVTNDCVKIKLRMKV